MIYLNIFLSNEIAVLSKAVQDIGKDMDFGHALDFLHRDSHQGRETFEVYNFDLEGSGMASHIQASLDIQCMPLVGLRVWLDSK